MKLLLVYPTLPPNINAIGDHTVLLARALQGHGHEVSIVAARGAGPESVPTHQILSHTRRSTLRIPGLLRRYPADWVLVQFEQFSYGGRGFNPFLAPAIFEARRRGAKVALLAHELYVASPPLRNVPMTLYQRPQFAALAATSDLLLVSTGAWLPLLRRRASRPEPGVFGVGSMLPPPRHSRSAARARLQIHSSKEIVVTFFGRATRNRSMGLLLSLLADAQERGPVRLLYVGPDARPVLGAVGSSVPITVVERASNQECADALVAGDVAACFYPDGVSARRTSFMAALALGIPVVTTLGVATDRRLMDASDRGVFALMDRPWPRQSVLTSALARREMGEAGRAFYARTFDWPVIAEQLLSLLARATDRDPARRSGVGRGRAQS